MATASNEIDQIRRRMAEIRRELHQDVREVVASAEAVADWRRYLRMYPWVTLGVSFGAGFLMTYLIVPRRHRALPADVATRADVARVREAIAEEWPRERPKEKGKKGLFAAAWGLVAPIAVRAVQGYAIQFLENWIAQQQQAMAGGPTPPRQPSAPGGPGPGPGPGPGRTRGPGGY